MKGVMRVRGDIPGDSDKDKEPDDKNPPLFRSGCCGLSRAVL